MGLLDTNLLLIDQVTGFLADDFAICDEHGSVLGGIWTQGGILRRFLAGNRQLAIVDPRGQLLVRVDDPPNVGRDRFELVTGDETVFARITKEFSLFRKELSVEIADGAFLRVTGSLFDHEFQVLDGDDEVARVSRTWPGVGAALLGHDRYVLAFSPAAGVSQRIATLGSVVALDLIRAKARRAAASSSS